jgi:hypothetical protein
MTVLTGGLETTEYGQQGWNAVHSANMELLDEKLVGVLLADKYCSEETIADPDAVTMDDLTDSTGGTPATTLVAISGSGADTDINNNIASLTSQLTKAKADIVALRGTVETLLGLLRITGGVGIFDDNP